MATSRKKKQRHQWPPALKQGTPWADVPLPPFPELESVAPYRASLLATVAPTLVLRKESAVEAQPSAVGFIGGSSAMLEQQWPTCRSCKTPYQVFAQLCLDDCAGLFDRSGFLTLFGCTDPECFDYELEPAAALAVWEASAQRWQTRPGESSRAAWSFLVATKAQHFVPWDEVIMTIPELDVDLEALIDFDDEVEPGDYVAFAGGQRFGSHLGGYPLAVQDGLGMVCECGRRMALLAQLDLSLLFLGHYYLSTCLGPKCVTEFRVHVSFQTT